MTTQLKWLLVQTGAYSGMLNEAYNSTQPFVYVRITRHFAIIAEVDQVMRTATRPAMAFTQTTFVRRQAFPMLTSD